MKNYIQFSLIGLIAFIIISCEKTEIPMALFDYQIDGITVQFTNYSTDATEYLWDFGDGNTSAEENPLHKYSESGSFIITLTVKGKGGTKTIKEMLKIQKPALIQIDGNFDDWDAVPAEQLSSAIGSSDASLTALHEMKACTDDNYIYLYLVYDQSKVAPLDIFINTDNNPSSGGNSWLWDPCGADFLIEGFITEKMEDAIVFNWPSDKPQDGWEWVEALGSGSGIINMSEPKTVNGNLVKVEMSIIKEMLPTSLASEIGIGIFSSNEDWAETGSLPNAPSGSPAPPLMKIKIQ
ncbi:MAG: PKD domain-containing protein [Petrimonas sp.]|uniref:PKD domain-containing protein n=1 Tax=Petrimonas sp. TaxID=2023866 RepID=UPI002B3CBA22|nr:PKD domain-containing protein [Petrimonas sp.]